MLKKTEIARMEYLTSIIYILPILTIVSSSPIATPSASVLTCHHDICSDGDEDFRCWERRLLCCKGGTNDGYQVLAQRNGFECCEGTGQQYEIQREICVSGQIRRRGKDEDNCGPNKVYNMTNEVCCDGNVFSKVAGAQCCGNEYLTGDTESCCNGIKYNTYEQVCCPRQENNPVLGKEQLFDIPYGRCCLDKPYDPRAQSCVEGLQGLQLINRASRNMQTCSGERYYPETHGCCRGTIVYEHRRMLCHRGRLYKKTDPDQNALCIYVDSEGENRRRAIPYTRNSKTACSSRLGVISLGPLEKLCGDEVYNTSTDLCCSGRRHESMKYNGFQCCNMGTKYFNPDRQICCLNQVSEEMAYNDGAKCCYKEPYSPKTHDCDGRTVTKKACPAYESKCNASVDMLQRMKKYYIHFGVAGELIQSRQSRRKIVREWPLSDMKTLKFKKGKATVVRAKSKGIHRLRSSECGCPQNLVPEARYMFVSTVPIRRRTLSLESASSGFIIPIEDKQQIGLVFETLIEKSR